MREDLKQAKALVFEMAKQKVLRELQSGLGQAKETYPNADIAEGGDAWLFLAEKKPDGKPVHTPESAAKLSHERALARFQTQPQGASRDHDESPTIRKQAVIAEYLKEKSAKDAAPVGKPSRPRRPLPYLRRKSSRVCGRLSTPFKEDGVLNQAQGSGPGIN